MFYLGKIALLFNYFSLVHTGLSLCIIEPSKFSLRLTFEISSNFRFLKFYFFSNGKFYFFVLAYGDLN